MVISRPCDHPQCPPRDGFVRGQYESVEFIREIPRNKPRKSLSATDLRRVVKDGDGVSLTDKEAMIRSAKQRSKDSAESLPIENHMSLFAKDGTLKEGRQRGKTISFAGSRGTSAKGEKVDTQTSEEDEDDMNPVEWVMITRSDPGGGIPRFMVDRGTPGSICVDAGKFLNWAVKKEHPEDGEAGSEKTDTASIKSKRREELEAFETNGHLAGLEEHPEEESGAADSVTKETQVSRTESSVQTESNGVLASVANAAYASIETFAPQILVDRLPGHQHSLSASMASTQESAPPDITKTPTHKTSTSSISSVGSFASAEDHFDNLSTKSSLSQNKPSGSNTDAASTPQEKELAKLNDRKRRLAEKLAKAREKELKDKQELTSKEEERVRKAEEKHAQEVAKQEERYRRELAKLDSKRQKEAAKIEEKKKRAEEKDEKSRLTREKEELRESLEVMTKERDLLRDQVGALQRENTILVTKIGKMNEGKDLLKEVQANTWEGGNRSRSGSMRRGKDAVAGTTVLGGGNVGLKENVKTDAADEGVK